MLLKEEVVNKTAGLAGPQLTILLLLAFTIYLLASPFCIVNFTTLITTGTLAKSCGTI